MMHKTELHRGQPVLTRGSTLANATGAMVMIHGRGATAADILSLADEFDAPDLAYLAPQAAGGTWYPNRFTAPLASNEPWLSSALATVAGVLARVADAGIPTERTLLLGFSQGGCLALEYAARNAQSTSARYGGLIGLSATLIENGDTARDYSGSLGGTPVFLGCGVPDPHIPRDRLERSAELLRKLGGNVTLRVYPGMGHTINQDEITFIQNLIETLL